MKTKYLLQGNRNVKRSTWLEQRTLGNQSGIRAPPLPELLCREFTMTILHSPMLRNNKLTVTIKGKKTISKERLALLRVECSFRKMSLPSQLMNSYLRRDRCSGFNFPTVQFVQRLTPWILRKRDEKKHLNLVVNNWRRTKRNYSSS
jgi:hypothetical protein